MAETEQDSKTEQPTEKRLEDARKKGEVPISQEFRTWVMLFGTTVVVLMFGPWMGERLQRGLRPFIEMPHQLAGDFGAIRGLLIDVALDVLAIVAAPFGVLMALALLGSVAQNGLVVSAEKLKPDLGKLNPLKAAQKYLTARPWLEFVKGIAKITLVGAVLVMVTWPRRQDMEALLGMEVPAQLVYLMDVLKVVMYTVLAITGLIAAADYAYQRLDFLKRMRMTKQEIQDEYKQSEGDPHVKARIRKLRVERARQRMMQAVPEADVVITNPTHYAVALKYDMEAMGAPVVVAKGLDHLALRIRALATEHEVGIVENPPLARALYAAVEIDQEIPPEHYKAVAEVIGYVMRLKGKLKR